MLSLAKIIAIEKPSRDLGRSDREAHRNSSVEPREIQQWVRRPDCGPVRRETAQNQRTPHSQKLRHARRLACRLTIFDLFRGHG